MSSESDSSTSQGSHREMESTNSSSSNDSSNHSWCPSSSSDSKEEFHRFHIETEWPSSSGIQSNGSSSSNEEDSDSEEGRPHSSGFHTADSDMPNEEEASPGSIQLADSEMSDQEDTDLEADPTNRMMVHITDSDMSDEEGSDLDVEPARPMVVINVSESDMSSEEEFYSDLENPNTPLDLTVEADQNNDQNNEDSYREEYDSDFEDPGLFHFLNIQSDQNDEPTGSEQDYELDFDDPDSFHEFAPYEINNSEDASQHQIQMTRGNVENPSSETIIETSNTSSTPGNQTSSHNIKNSQPVTINSSGDTTDSIPANQEIYDPEFEDPRLFDVLNQGNEIPKNAVLSSHHKKIEEPEERHMWPCVVCLDKPPDILFNPCLHVVCCQECAALVENTGKCPVCSSSVQKVDRLFFTQKSCVVCLDRPPETVFKPCCHAVCCETCAVTLTDMENDYTDDEDELDSKCPVCNAYIRDFNNFNLAYT